MGRITCLRARIAAVGAAWLLIMSPGLLLPETANAAPPAGGTLVVTVTDGNGNPLPGACFEVDTRGGGYAAAGCDLFDSRLDGTTTMNGIAPGDDVLTLISLPRDYLFGQSRPVTIRSGQTTKVAIQLEAAGDSIAIATVDEQGATRWGACYAVFRLDQQGPTSKPAGQGCDRSDGINDGSTTIGGLTNGTYAVVETSPPPGYALPAAQDATIASDRDASVTVTVKPGGGYASITDVDGNRDAVPGACFRAYTDAGHDAPGRLVALSCDYDDGADDGTTRLAGLPTGHYVLVQSRGVPGFTRAGNQPLVVAASEDPAIVVVTPRLNETTPPATEAISGGEPPTPRSTPHAPPMGSCPVPGMHRAANARPAGASCPS